MLQNITNIREPHNILPNITKRYKTLQNITKKFTQCYKTLKNVIYIKYITERER